MAVEVAIEDLTTWLSQQPDNTVDTPYEVSVTGLTSSNLSTLTSALNSNGTKYIDLRTTVLPLVTSLYITTGGQTQGLFYGCYNLVYAPSIPDTVTDIQEAFYRCTNLKSAPEIPNSVTNMTSTFLMCFRLQYPPVIPNSVTNMYQTFAFCTSLIQMPNIPSGVTTIQNLCNGCTALVNANVTIPTSVEDTRSAFYGCNHLKTAPRFDDTTLRPYLDMGTMFRGCSVLEDVDIPSNVTELIIRGAFINCTSLRVVNKIPSCVTKMESCFNGCTSLETIKNFDVPLATVQSNYSHNCFSGCTSLSEIFLNDSAEESSDWHIMKLDIGNSSFSGKIFDRTGASVSIPSTNITKDKMILPVKTDELWFPDSNYTDQEIEAIIQKVIQYRYSYFIDHNTVPVDEQSFIMWADKPENFHTNLPVVAPTVVDVVEEDNMNPVTSNAVFQNRPSVKQIFNQNATSTSSAYNISESILNFDYIVCVATMYGADRQRTTLIIPKEEIKVNSGNNVNDDYVLEATLSGTTRRITWNFPTETTLRIGYRDGTSGNLPVFKAIYGYNLFN